MRRTLATLTALAACNRGEWADRAPAPAPAEGAAVIDDEPRVEVFDRRGTRRAIGVPHPEAPGEIPVGDGHLPMILEVVDDATGEVRRPAGDGIVIDAALGPAPGQVAWLDPDGRVCDARACVAGGAVPGGMDVNAAGRIAFVADNPIGTDIAIADLEHGKATVLISGPGFRDRPVFSPDGAEVAFVASSEGGLASLFAARPGEPPRQITNVGLRLGPPGPERIPAGAVPPPLDAATLRWDADGIRYLANGATWRVDPSTGEAAPEDAAPGAPEGVAAPAGAPAAEETVP